mmetsp:Transcript_10185/g.13287  ORF Transcript_10185/g.13287 Transcript_10185/m.13287 type:complete len:200 (-) Transcript_10185:432-1031(-)
MAFLPMRVCSTSITFFRCSGGAGPHSCKFPLRFTLFKFFSSYSEEGSSPYKSFVLKSNSSKNSKGLNRGSALSSNSIPLRWFPGSSIFVIRLFSLQLTPFHWLAFFSSTIQLVLSIHFLPLVIENSLAKLFISASPLSIKFSASSSLCRACWRNFLISSSFIRWSYISVSFVYLSSGIIALKMRFLSFIMSSAFLDLFS